MPELPEVETTRRGVQAYVLGKKIQSVQVRNSRLRWPVSESVDEILGDEISAIDRRAKYLIFKLRKQGALLVHLGMSGSLRVTASDVPYKKHDHVIIGLAGDIEMRYRDPRRFGMVLHLPPEEEVHEHKLLANLGPEPFSSEFDAEYLAECCAGRRTSIKQVIMDGKVVVGVGNIYASEALFRAGIRPTAIATKVSRARLEKLCVAIVDVLNESIKSGGTTLRDFLSADGEPGYFRQRLFVYEREGQPCRTCDGVIKSAVIGQRSTYWCPRCQR